MVHMEAGRPLVVTQPWSLVSHLSRHPALLGFRLCYIGLHGQPVRRDALHF